jgi:23S rRNA (cytosine1962-C5)-methyltransferase
LNLFAYTGASTMALVAAGFHVAHVDAAKPNVQSARLAAQHNGWPDAPIRYLVDDASKFVAREIRRGRTYHTIILDPPAYGHSPEGKAWRIERDLWPLLDNCLQLVDPRQFRLLITGHSPEVGEQDVCRYLKDKGFFGHRGGGSGLILDSGRSQLGDRHHRALDSGFYIRASATS